MSITKIQIERKKLGNAILSNITSYATLSKWGFFQVEEMRTHFVLYRQCGTKHYNALVAKGNAVEVSFRSDDFGSGRGFKLTWSGMILNGTCKIIKLLLCRPRQLYVCLGPFIDKIGHYSYHLFISTRSESNNYIFNRYYILNYDHYCISSESH